MNGMCDWHPCSQPAKWRIRNKQDQSCVFRDFKYCDQHASFIRNNPMLNKGTWRRIFASRSKVTVAG